MIKSYFSWSTFEFPWVREIFPFLERVNKFHQKFSSPGEEFELEFLVMGDNIKGFYGAPYWGETLNVRIWFCHLNTISDNNDKLHINQDMYFNSVLTEIQLQLHNLCEPLLLLSLNDFSIQLHHYRKVNIGHLDCPARTCSPGLIIFSNWTTSSTSWLNLNIISC